MFDLGPRIETGEHYALLRHTLTLQPKGTALEFGVGPGESTRIIADHMPVIGFDSWQGLPEDWRQEFPKGSFTHQPPNVPGAEFVDGWFEDTVPGFDFESLGFIGLIHLDADLYSSTATALKHLTPVLESGCFLVFDEFHSYPEAAEHEQRAFREFIEPFFDYRVIGHGHEAWSIQIA